MQGHCPYCHQFDPVLSSWHSSTAFPFFPTPWMVRGYRLSGSITGATGRDADLLPDIPVATPTTFLVNVNTLEALRFYRGQRMPPVLWRGWIPF